MASGETGAYERQGPCDAGVLLWLLSKISNNIANGIV